MKKRTKRIIIAAVIVAVVAAGAAAYGAVAADAAQAAKFGTVYGTDMATTGDITLTVSGSGNLKSAKNTIVNAAVHLDIENVLVSAGDTVEPGQPIATLDLKKMQKYADDLESQIIADQNSLNTTISTSSSDMGGRSSTSTSTTKTPTSKTTTTTTTTSSGTSTTTITSPNVVTKFRITSPVKGWVKNIVAGTKESNNSIEETMKKYGYLAVVATEEKELISAAGSGLAQGDTVKVKCEGKTYTGTVVTKNGNLYVQIDTITRTVGADAAVYDQNGSELFTGQIQLAAYIPVISNYGTIISVRVKENQKVSVDQILFKAEQYSLTVKNLYNEILKLQAEYKAVTDLISAGQLSASDSGIINTLNISNGQTYEEGAVLMTLDSPDDWVATVSVDEVDINSVQVGQDATVTLDALTGKTFSGKVERISRIGAASGGVTTYDVDVSVESDPGFKAGMSVTCEITSQQAEGVVMVPVTDVKNINSHSYVMVQVTRTEAEKKEIKEMINNSDYAGLSKYMGADASALGITRLADPVQLLYGEVRAVQTGIQNASYIEIKSGLTEGEKILAQTTNSNSDTQRNFMMGAFGADMPGGFTQRQSRNSAGGGR